ncbi:hypothetical protein D3C71_1027710 [compost metagenome]
MVEDGRFAMNVIGEWRVWCLKKNGNFTRPVRIFLSLIGIVLCALGLRFDIYLLALAGMVVGAIGMYASKASTVGIKPFGEKVN